jgi:hypothetical protein
MVVFSKGRQKDSVGVLAVTEREETNNCSLSLASVCNHEVNPSGMIRIACEGESHTLYQNFWPMGGREFILGQSEGIASNIGLRSARVPQSAGEPGYDDCRKRGNDIALLTKKRETALAVESQPYDSFDDGFVIFVKGIIGICMFIVLKASLKRLRSRYYPPDEREGENGGKDKTKRF